jgi:hypothetical protein
MTRRLEPLHPQCRFRTRVNDGKRVCEARIAAPHTIRGLAQFTDDLFLNVEVTQLKER